MLREKISTMETELVTFRDLDSLKKKSEEKKQVNDTDRSYYRSAFMPTLHRGGM
jgi:hypothetical protein